MYKLHTGCRACGYATPESATLKESLSGMAAYGQTERLVSVCDLGVMPLANDFCRPEDERSGYAPLKVMLCPNCHLAQLSVVVSPSVLYSSYAYVTSPSATMKNHFAALLYDLRDEQGKISTLLEIASNDGALMGFFRENEIKCVGIDPAKNLCKLARDRGFQVLDEEFQPSHHKWVHHTIGVPDVILARHVFAHIDNWRQFVDSLESVSGRDTLIAIEVPYLDDQMESLSFDQIYHEHLSYVSVGAVNALLKPTGLRLHKIVHYGIHGGSILIMLRKKDNPKAADPSVANFIKNEKVGPERWKKFDTNCQSLVRQLRAYVESLADQGKSVVGYGASAKSCQWLNACGFTNKQVRFIADGTLQKMYRNAPGSEIPVLDEGALTRELPDYAICFAWNFFKEIFEKEKIFRSKGGKWIVPLPKFEVI
jgi:hypothetical protein